VLTFSSSTPGIILLQQLFEVALPGQLTANNQARSQSRPFLLFLNDEITYSLNCPEAAKSKDASRS
jgi:hypothetical protein